MQIKYQWERHSKLATSLGRASMIEVVPSNPILVASAATGLGSIFVETIVAERARRARLPCLARRCRKTASNFGRTADGSPVN